MDRNSLIRRLMATFLGELDEHVRSLNRDLLALEKDPDGPSRDEAFSSMLRAMHSLKGASRSVNVAPIESISHLLEELIVAGRDGRLSFDRDLFAILFTSADAIEEAGIRLREEADLADSPLVALLPHLESIAAESSKVATAPARVPSPAPAPTPASSTAAEAPSGGTDPAIEAPAGQSFVRVPAEKLDALLTHSGELLVARRR